METAGKQVDEDLRELMKENGIGRPSTRANIIETLFKRQYIVRNKKTGVTHGDWDSVDWYHSK
jgi:DNA topoisomerase-3